MTNLLPSKEDYDKKYKNHDINRNDIYKLKQKFISCKEYDTTKLPPEYKDFMYILKQTRYDDIPNYYELINILRRIAINKNYDMKQYDIDHSPDLLSFIYNYLFCLKNLFYIFSFIFVCTL